MHMHQALVKDKRFDDLLYLMPAAQTSDKTAVAPEQIKNMVQELKQEFDYVIIDRALNRADHRNVCLLRAPDAFCICPLQRLPDRK